MISARLDRIAKRQNVRQIWIKIAKRFYKLAKLQVLRETQRELINMRSNASNVWHDFSEKARQRDKERRFRAARKAVQFEQNSRKEIERAMNSAPNRVRMRKSKVVEEEEVLERDPRHEELVDLWRSFAKRFAKQSMFNTISDWVAEMKRQKIHDRERYREKWQALAALAIREDDLDAVATARADMDLHYALWRKFVSRKVLRVKAASVKAEYSKWNARKWKTEAEVRLVWMKLSRRLVHNWRALRRIRESIALRKITNFVMYVMMPRRASFVALALKPTFAGFGRIMAQRQVHRSVKTIKNALRRRMGLAAEVFAEDWSGCLAEACSSIAAYQVGAPQEFVPVRVPVAVEVSSESEPELQFESYPTKIVKIDALEEDSDAPVQLDFDDELAPRVHFKSPMKEKVVVVQTAEKAKKNENVEINIDPWSSESSAEVVESRRPCLAISSPAMREFKRNDDEVLRMMAPVVVPEGVHRSATKKRSKHPKKPKIHLKPDVKKRSLESIMKRYGCHSDLEDLGEDENDRHITELDFNFNDDASMQRTQLEEDGSMEEEETATQRTEQVETEVTEEEEANEPSCNMVFESNAEKSEQEEEPICAFEFEKSSVHNEEEHEDSNPASDEDSERVFGPPRELSSIDETDENIICRDYSD